MKINDINKFIILISFVFGFHKANSQVLQADYPAVVNLKKVSMGGNLNQVAGYPEDDTIVINSIKQLVEYAGKDSVNVKMVPGSYNYSDSTLAERIILKTYVDGVPANDYPVSTLLHFSGNHSTYNLEGVVININTILHTAFDSDKIYELFVTGNSNTIRGLFLKDVGDIVPTNSAIMVQVMGNDNTLEEVELFVEGSYPYGYGYLLGKGGGNLVPLHKHSSLLVTGTNTKLLGCKVVTHAFGHGIVMQGAVNTHIEDCYVEGEMRTTDEMLQETDGPAFDVGFQSVYPPGNIEPGQMIALAEDGIRTYADSPLVTTKTSNVTVINCTVKNMRSGYSLEAGGGEKIISGCTAIGTQEKAFGGASNIVITNSKGDAMFGPLLSYRYISDKNSTVELELMASDSIYPPGRLAEINGSNHNITISNFENEERNCDLPIVFGESFNADVKIFRDPTLDMSDLAGATGVSLQNKTGMPVILTERAYNCSVTSNTADVTDQGTNNTVTIVE